MSQWIVFHEIAARPKAKTRRWEVRSKPGGDPLGNIEWLRQWRQYCFFAAEDSFFGKHCLRDIADFCEEQTRPHREARGAVRQIGGMV